MTMAHIYDGYKYLFARRWLDIHFISYTLQAKAKCARPLYLDDGLDPLTESLHYRFKDIGTKVDF